MPQNAGAAWRGRGNSPRGLGAGLLVRTGRFPRA